MTGKTSDVYHLVSDAIKSVPQPYTADVIEDVCCVIEKDPILLSRYDALVASLGKMVTNNAIGTHTKALAGMQTVKQVSASKATIIGSYTKLK